MIQPILVNEEVNAEDNVVENVPLSPVATDFAAS